MKIIPVASDSLGTRSMATFVETKDIRLLIDPSTALGPYRYGLSPHPLEIKKLEEHWNLIKRYAKRADLLAVTHYHYDHHNPSEPEIYEGKIVFLKHPTENINLSQKNRAKYFLEHLGNLPKKLEFSEEKELVFGRTKIKFSKAVPHGANARLGYVTEVLVREGKESFAFSSDVEGPVLKEQTDFLIREKPKIIYLDGPMTYMLNYRYSQESLDKAIANLIKIIKEAKPKKIIMDHHLLRDLKWNERMEKVLRYAEKNNVQVSTAAEFLGKRNEMLEARRKELYGEGKLKSQ